MKAFLVLAAIGLALASSSANPTSTTTNSKSGTSSTQQSGQTTTDGMPDAERFLLGVLNGYVEKKYDINLTCVYDDLVAVVNDLEAAVQNGEAEQWTGMVTDLWSAIRSLESAIKSCQPAEPWWEKILNDIKTILDLAFPEVAWIDDALSVVVNGVEVGTDAYSFYTNYEAGKYFPAGEAVGNLIATVIAQREIKVQVKPEADPSPPAWPLGFSASVFATNWQNQGQNVFFRWFYDQTEDQARIDGIGTWLNEQYWSTMIFDHVHEIQWTVYYQPGFETCFMKKINTTLPIPNFKGAIYAGQGVINYQPVYHWILNQGNGFIMQYFDDQVYRQPVRMDFDDASKQMADTLLLMEFDAGVQDPSLFVLPEQITATCNGMTTPTSTV